MPAPFEAEVTNSIRNLQSAVNSLKNSVEKTDKSIRGVGHGIRSSFHPNLIRPATNEAKLFGETLEGISKSAKHIGGPLGAGIKKIGEVFGISGGLGAVATAAGLAGFAFMAYNRVVEANIARTRLAIAAHKELSDTIRAGRQQMLSNSLTGLSQKKSVAKLVALGGQAALDKADEIARGGIVDAASAQSGVAKANELGLRPGNNRGMSDNAINVGQIVANSGGDFESAIDEISKDRFLQGRLKISQSEYDQAGPAGPQLIGKRSNEVANRILSKQYGVRYGQDYVATARFNKYHQDSAGANFLKAADRVTGVQTEEGTAAREMLTQNGEAAARDVLVKFTTPIATAITELARTRAEEIRALNLLSKAQDGLHQALADLTSTDGSFRTQGRRAKNAQAGASFGPGDTHP